MATVRYSFTLDAIQDADLVRWLGTQPNTSAAVREALRTFMDRPGHAQLDDKLERILEALRNVRVVKAGEQASEHQADAGEPARARAGLDKMKARFRNGGKSG